MKSSDEEYLDSLLNSAKTNNNPQSALSRMSSKANNENSADLLDSESEDIGALIDNSTGNKEIAEVGELMDKADRDELIDDSLASLLDDIQKPTDPEIPTFTVGNDPVGEDIRDAEEIALDEAIADAEKNEADRQNNISANEETPKDDIVIPDVSETVPIIDDSELVDALAEMAPEVDLPDDNSLIVEKESDADQTPEEILTDLLDDMPGSLMGSPGGQENSLTDIIDREREAEGAAAPNSTDDVIDLQSLDNLTISEPSEEVPGEDASNEEVSNEEVSNEEIPNEEALNEDTFDLEAAIAEAGVAEPSEEPSGQEGANEMVTEDSISDLESLLNMDEFAGESGADGASPENEETPENLDTEPAPDNDELSVSATELGFIEEDDHHSPVGLDEISEDDINLNDLEANLDELLGGMTDSYETTEGEVAKILGDEPQEAQPEETTQDSEDVSLPDLDALMNSLANDEVESLEETAHLDQELGPQEEELNKEDILDAITETGFDDLGTDLALDAISALPDMDIPENADDAQSQEHGKHRRHHKENIFQKLIRLLTEEDDDFENLGTEGLASLTDENQKVLAELGEGGAPKKPKKEKKKKEKAKKPPKEKKPKKEKPPKEKKPKKEKPAKAPEEPSAPSKPMAPKKIAVSGIFAASLGILVCIPALILPVKTATDKAKLAYVQSDFIGAYKLLHGKTMTTEQKTMYEKSRVIAWAERYLKGYENYKAMNKEVEALDMLLMSERNKEKLLEDATKFNVEKQVSSVYDSIESLLSENYGLSEEDINEINSIKKDRDYTIRIMEVLGMFEE